MTIRFPRLLAACSFLSLLTPQDVLWAQQDSPPPPADSGKPERPNVIFILTDNHGAWTLGAYGNKDIRTPHIDRLAREGVLFENAFANNPVCSPTRATYLTGLMPSQHGVHNFLGGGGLQTGPEARNTLENFTSLPEILDRNGYSCGLVGKWHLGGNETPQEALDDYWITMPHGGTSTFHEATIIENGKTRKEPEHLTTFWTKHAVQFIEQEKNNPFFLYLAYNGPYGLSRFQLEDLRGPRAADYADQDLPSFPGGVIHPWEYHNREYFGNPTAIRRYAAEVSAIDDGVGEILATLQRLGLDENTVICFAADQGWAGGQRGFWGMGDHTRPTNAFEFSMRIPLIFRHPGKIPAGRTAPEVTSNYDFMPSLLSYLGLGNEMPENPPSPGHDYSPVLLGEPVGEWENAVFYEYEDLRCVRTPDWKLIERFDDGYDELYHLAEDPDEQLNLWGVELYAETQAQLQEKLNAFFEKYAEPEYNLWKGGSSQPRTLTWGEEARAREAARAEKGIAPSPFDPSWNPPHMTVPPGMVVEVVAAPPLVNHPMMASFDDRGRLFVAEAAGVNLNKEELEKETPNQIRLLEDTNNDGIFDKSTIFADDMTFPQGVQWLNGALYTASPPSIWMMVDVNNDGVSDQRFEIATGFDYTGNAADVHGPFLHPNGRLYWCHGRKGHEVWDGDPPKLISQGKGARIWSSLPDGSDVRVHAGGGMDNPVEVDFTSTGEIIGSVNLFHGRPRGDVLVHWLRGGAYPRHDQEAVVAEFRRTGPLLPEIHDFGHVAISGMCLYESGALHSEWKGDVISSFFNTQRIVRTPLKPSGATWEAGRSETIMEAHDPNVHFTDVLEDADGSLLAIDTGGWFRIGCPTSQIARPDIPGAIYRLRPAGIPDRKTDRRGLGIPWEDQSLEELVDLLDDERLQVRRRAIAQIATFAGDPAEVLREVIDTGSQEAKLNALWAACRHNSENCQEVVRWAVQDKDPLIATAACNAIVATRDPLAVDVVVDQLSAADASLRLAAANALSSIRSPESTLPLMDQLARPLSRPEEHAVIHALIQIADWEGTVKGLLSEDLEVRRRTLWALDQMPESRLRPEDVLLAMETGNEALMEDAIQIASWHQDWSAAIGLQLGVWLDQNALNPRRMEIAAALAPAHLEADSVQRFAGRLATQSEPLKKALGLQIMASARPGLPLHSSWEGALGQALNADADRDHRMLAVKALTKIESETFDERLKEIAADPAIARTVRFQALRAGSDPSKPLATPAFTLLMEMLQSQSDPEERAEAVALAGELKFSNDQMIALADVLQTAGPVDFAGLLVPFASHRTPEVGAALAEAVAINQAAASVPVTELNRVIDRYPPDSTATVQERLNALEEAQNRRLEHLDTLLARVEAGEGNAERGREAFLAGKGACITCHKAGEAGRDVGPNLTTIGRIRNARDLMESVLFPGASIARDFEGYMITMKDGALHMGIIRNESDEVLNIVAVGGLEVALRRDEVVSITPAPVSLMPIGLEQSLPEQELIDLVTWLDGLE